MSIILKFFKYLSTNIKKKHLKKLLFVLAAAFLGYLYIKSKNKTAYIPLNIPIKRFLQAFTAPGWIRKVVLVGSKIYAFPSKGHDYYEVNVPNQLTTDLMKKIIDNPDIDNESIVFGADDQQNWKLNFSLLGAIFLSSYFLGKKLGENLNIGKMNGDRKNKISVTFADVHGLEEAKKDLTEIIDYFKDPEKYKTIGARLRRGVLLYGPPGTGKTLLARATAGESNANFLNCSASEFVELYVGVGAKRVRELFKKARESNPCIIFIDEIDGIGAKRKVNFGLEQSSDNERSTTLNQLLTEMDGFEANENIVVIAATNRETLLDDALLRSGRFDTKLKINLPNYEDRIGILKIHLRKKKHSITNEFINSIARISDKFSGADLENIINECAYVAISKKKDSIDDEDLKYSYDRFVQQRKPNIDI